MVKERKTEIQSVTIQITFFFCEMGISTRQVVPLHIEKIEQVFEEFNSKLFSGVLYDLLYANCIAYQEFLKYTMEFSDRFPIHTLMQNST